MAASFIEILRDIRDRLHCEIKEIGANAAANAAEARISAEASEASAQNAFTRAAEARISADESEASAQVSKEIETRMWSREDFDEKKANKILVTPPAESGLLSEIAIGQKFQKITIANETPSPNAGGYGYALLSDGTRIAWNGTSIQLEKDEDGNGNWETAEIFYDLTQGGIISNEKIFNSEVGIIEFNVLDRGAGAWEKTSWHYQQANYYLDLSDIKNALELMISILDGRVTVNENNIENIFAAIAIVKGHINEIKTDVKAIDDRVTDNETTITNINEEIAAIENFIYDIGYESGEENNGENGENGGESGGENNGENGGENNAPKTLAGRVTANEKNIKALQAAIALLENRATNNETIINEINQTVIQISEKITETVTNTILIEQRSNETEFAGEVKRVMDGFYVVQHDFPYIYNLENYSGQRYLDITISLLWNNYYSKLGEQDPDYKPNRNEMKLSAIGLDNVSREIDTFITDFTRDYSKEKIDLSAISATPIAIKLENITDPTRQYISIKIKGTLYNEYEAINPIYLQNNITNNTDLSTFVPAISPGSHHQPIYGKIDNTKAGEISFETQYADSIYWGQNKLRLDSTGIGLVFNSSEGEEANRQTRTVSFGIDGSGVAIQSMVNLTGAGSFTHRVYAFRETYENPYDVATKKDVDLAVDWLNSQIDEIRNGIDNIQNEGGGSVDLAQFASDSFAGFLAAIGQATEYAPGNSTLLQFSHVSSTAGRTDRVFIAKLNGTVTFEANPYNGRVILAETIGGALYDIVNVMGWGLHNVSLVAGRHYTVTLYNTTLASARLLVNDVLRYQLTAPILLL
ncbi:MAG: hypothetical protein LBU73_08005 [Helicobacteraceae bacterium]|jgi:hypothetical protein|nr:hypothetical protein [Helicobacteraceae bacterium]